MIKINDGLMQLSNMPSKNLEHARIQRMLHIDTYTSNYRSAGNENSMKARKTQADKSVLSFFRITTMITTVRNSHDHPF